MLKNDFAAGNGHFNTDGTDFIRIHFPWILIQGDCIPQHVGLQLAF